MTNTLVGSGGDDGPRVLGDEVEALLLEHPQVVAWVNGHTHMNQVWAHRRADGAGGFWEINTASHADFPDAVAAGRGHRQRGRHAVAVHHDARPRRPRSPTAAT
jgi:hypothetical protein